MIRTCRAVAAGLLLALCVAAGAQTFEGVVTHVTDGDTLSVRPTFGGAPREVRIEGIDAPERCQAHGRRARDALASRVLHRQVTVRSRARDDYDRTLGRVSLGDEDIGAWMVASGHAWSYRYRKSPGPYAKQQAKARQATMGLWRANEHLEPVEFRKRFGSCKVS